VLAAAVGADTVANFKMQPIRDLQPYGNIIIFSPFVNTVFKDVLHQGDEEHGRDLYMRDILFHLDSGFYGVAYAHFFQVDVIPDEVHFGGQGYFLVRALFQEVAYDGAELFDEIGRQGGFALGDEIDIVQGIEEKMWLYLGL
jgi:hypothetical protein